MVVITPGTEAVQCRHDIPNEVGIAEPASLLRLKRDSQLSCRGLPALEQRVGAGIARPGAAFGQELDLDLAGIPVGRAANRAWTGQSEQAFASSGMGLGTEGAELAFSDGLMWHAIKHSAAG